MNVRSAPIALSTCFSTFAQTAAVGSLRGRSAPRQNGDPGYPSRNDLRRPNACPCLTAVRILLHTPSEFARSHRRGDDAMHVSHWHAIDTGRADLAHGQAWQLVGVLGARRTWRQPLAVPARRTRSSTASCFRRWAGVGRLVGRSSPAKPIACVARRFPLDHWPLPRADA
jgi:hypothetical protein